MGQWKKREDWSKRLIELQGNIVSCYQADVINLLNKKINFNLNGITQRAFVKGVYFSSKLDREVLEVVLL